MPQAPVAGTGAGAACWRMLTYGDVCSRMLTYADVCSRMLTLSLACHHSAVPCVARLAALLALLVHRTSYLLVTALLALLRDIICGYLCHAVAACFSLRRG